MIISNTLTKKLLETFIQETFLNFGAIISASMLDSIKLLGFHYATNAGISVNIEDLKTPKIKDSLIKSAEKEILDTNVNWYAGVISETERFQKIIDSWNNVAESLKDKIISYYRNYDPINSLYIMAFSGARGNISQVRQLIGMRGLMADQNGQIIDLPIQANFREGLSSIDYLISSYGARKGIVDTALKTADSGYLTRRLVYLAHDLIIREIDCKTHKGLLFFYTKEGVKNSILGRTIISVLQLLPNKKKVLSFFKNKTINELTLDKLNNLSPAIIMFRSPLTCISVNSICQKCYGWDLVNKNLVPLGSSIGVTAAQSVGEPGTQLTMRTFHTGGVFSGELLKQVYAPFSGTISLPKNFKSISLRTNHGLVVLKLQEDITSTLRDWQGTSKQIFLKAGSYLHIKSNLFIQKGTLIAEILAKSDFLTIKKIKPIQSPCEGEILLEKLNIKNVLFKKKILKIAQTDGVAWLASGNLFFLPLEAKINFFNSISEEKPCFLLKLISPIQGLFSFNSYSLEIKNKKNKILLDLKSLIINFNDLNCKYINILKNYQYIDCFTILGYFYIYLKKNEKVYSICQKKLEHIKVICAVLESNTWKINFDQVNIFPLANKKIKNFHINNIINKTSILSKNGILLKKNGLNIIFQKTYPIFLTKGTILNYKDGDFIKKNNIFANLLNSIQQTEDIVQGLPKVEELFELNKSSKICVLNKKPTIFFCTNANFKEIKIKNNTINIYFSLNNLLKNSKSVYYNIFSGFENKETMFFYNKNCYKKVSLNKDVQLVQKGNISILINRYGQILLPTEDIFSSFWFTSERKKNLYNLQQNILKDSYFQISKVFVNKNGYVLFVINENSYMLLKPFMFFKTHNISNQLDIFRKSGKFFDLSEQLSDGSVDLQEMLNTIYNYHLNFDEILIGLMRSILKFQLILANSIQSIYQSQSTKISIKHLEVLVKQLISSVLVTTSEDSPFFVNEQIKLTLYKEIYAILKNLNKVKIFKVRPIIFSATSNILNKDTFLSVAGFQETKRILTNSAIKGSTDWLYNIKSAIIIGRSIPAGSTFLQYKNYLDNIFRYKKNLKNL